MDEKNSLVPLTNAPLNRQYRDERIGSALRSAQNFAADKNDPRLQDACREMESLFLTYLLKEMRATVDKSGFISGGRGEEIFTSLLDGELSKKMSAAGGIGLSSMLLEQLGGKTVKNDGSDSD